jgi:hypothetical protein
MTTFELAIMQVFMRACADLREADIAKQPSEKFRAVASALEAAYPEEVLLCKKFHSKPGVYL